MQDVKIFIVTIIVSMFLCFQSVGSKWEKTEIDFLKTYIEHNPPPNPISNEYWRTLASNLNETFGTSRTGLLNDVQSEYKFKI